MVVNILYIDDKIDNDIEKYIYELYKPNALELLIPDLKIVYDGHCFTIAEGYESLLNLQKVQKANIIVIDSRLFENNTIDAAKFSGEEFKLILKKIYPFIEVLVMTQNDDVPEKYGVIRKYNRKARKEKISMETYYDQTLSGHIDEAIKRIAIFSNIAAKLMKNLSIDTALLESILGSLDGMSKYDRLTTEDIDKLIDAFNELEEMLDE